MTAGAVFRTASCLVVAAAISLALLYIYAVPLAGAPMWAVVAASVLGWAISVPFSVMTAPRRTAAR